MAARIALIFASVLVIFQILLIWSCDAGIVKREADQDAPPKTLNETIQSIKAGIESFVERVKAHQAYQNVTNTLVQASQSAHQQIKELYNKLQQNPPST